MRIWEKGQSTWIENGIKYVLTKYDNMMAIGKINNNI